MNYSDYQERIKEFAVYPRIGNNLSYPVLGLISEFGDEFLTKLGEFEGGNSNAFGPMKDEAGDCFWFLGTSYTEIEEDWSSVLSRNAKFYDNVYNTVQNSIECGDQEDIITSLLALFGMLAGYASKADRDNNGKLLNKHRTNFVKTLLVLQATLTCLLDNYDVLTLDVIEDNLSKLESRKERNVLHGDGDKR